MPDLRETAKRPLDVTDVFVPTTVPTVTYVDRPDQGLEKSLRDALDTPGMIISIAGPSKSGKTVLVNKVIPNETLIVVSGGAIDTPDRLWERVLDWMCAPSEISETSGRTDTSTSGWKSEANISIAVAGVKGTGEGSEAGSSKTETLVKRKRSGIDQVVKEIAASAFVVFIDDFHYMPQDVQQYVARQIKEAAEKKVRICTASVPHRADDVVRGNPELRGRVQAINFSYWDPHDIAVIATQGFKALGVTVTDTEAEQMAAQAFGSPQLMQAICLQACRELGVRDSSGVESGKAINQEVIGRALENTSSLTDFSSLLEALHSGPKLRGQERKQFNLIDGTKGDVYRCVLLCLQRDPPLLTFSYDEILKRTREVCSGEAPNGSSVSQALEQISSIAVAIQPTARAVEWGDNVLDIVDPYFLFYLRFSKKLNSLGRE